MQIISKFRNPIKWTIGVIIKYTIKKIFFKNIENKDFLRLFSYTIDLLPNQTFLNIIKLLINTLKSKPSEIINLITFKEILIHTIPSDKRSDIAGGTKFLFIFLIISNIMKRLLIIFKTIILFPFKLGVYSFIGYLVGIKVD